jgi:hypothetical protein
MRAARPILPVEYDPSRADAAEGTVMRDASEYRFHVGERQLTVRTSAPQGSTTDLVAAGRDYQDRCELFLGATAVSVSAPTRTGNGAETVTVTATLPDGRLRAALLRFVTGPLVELTLTSPNEDPGADAEFARLVASARPSAATPTQAVARGLAAEKTGTTAHPAGPLLLDLTGYTARPELALESLDGRERYQFNPLTAPTVTAVRAGLAAPHLAGDVESAVGGDGHAVRYEVVTPRHFAKRAVRTAAPAPQAALRGTSDGATGTTGDVVGGSVRGVALQVRLAGTGATPERARQLLQDLQNAN